MEEWFKNEGLLIIYKLMCARQKQTMDWLKDLEEELRNKNRFFPRNKIIDKIEMLKEAPHKKLHKNDIIYRARTIDKYYEEDIFKCIFEDIYSMIKVEVPDFEENGTEFEWIRLFNIQQKHGRETILSDEQCAFLYDKYGKYAWWGYSEMESDAPPKGKAGVGRINPKGISYLYAANNVRTATLEVRPVISQYVSVAEIKITSDINLFDFTTNYEFEDAQKHFDQSVDLTVLGNYFSQPNYSGEMAYLATQYISEYIKNIKDESGMNIFDGLCFRSSLDSDGINYVLFDVSDTKKYSVMNSSVYQVMDLFGNLQRQLPLPDNII